MDFHGFSACVFFPIGESTIFVIYILARCYRLFRVLLRKPKMLDVHCLARTKQLVCTCLHMGYVVSSKTSDDPT